MPKVYVVQEQYDKNVVPAQRYGQLEFLLPQGAVVISTGPSIFRLNQKLQHYTYEDYILPIGDPVAIGLAVAIAARVTDGKVKLLRWDRQERIYIPIDANIA